MLRMQLRAEAQRRLNWLCDGLCPCICRACVKMFIYGKASLFWKLHLCCQIPDFDWPGYISASANVGRDIWSKGRLDAYWTQLMLILDRYQDGWMCSFASAHIECLAIPINLMQFKMKLNLARFFHLFQRIAYFATISVQRSKNNTVIVVEDMWNIYDSFWKKNLVIFSRREGEKGKK